VVRHNKADNLSFVETGKIEAMEKLQKHMRDTKNNHEFFEAMTRNRQGTCR
jgi:transcription termination factor Rho